MRDSILLILMALMIVGTLVSAGMQVWQTLKAASFNQAGAAVSSGIRAPMAA